MILILSSFNISASQSFRVYSAYLVFCCVLKNVSLAFFFKKQNSPLISVANVYGIRGIAKAMKRTMQKYSRRKCIPKSFKMRFVFGLFDLPITLTLLVALLLFAHFIYLALGYFCMYFWLLCMNVWMLLVSPWSDELPEMIKKTHRHTLS